MRQLPTYDSLTADQRQDVKLMEATIRKITSEQVLEGIRRELIDTHPDFAEYLEAYLNENKGKDLLFGWYREGRICALCCPEDHSGRWFMHIDNLAGVGQIREHKVAVIESLARHKRLL